MLTASPSHEASALERDCQSTEKDTKQLLPLIHASDQSGSSQQVLLDSAATMAEMAATQKHKPHCAALTKYKEETKQSSHFLSLPAELRNRIYEEVLSVAVPRDPEYELFISGPLIEQGYYSIVLACKQTYRESIGIYYSCHTFGFSDAQDATEMGNFCIDWLRRIKKEHREQIQHIEFDTMTLGHVKGHLSRETGWFGDRPREQLFPGIVAEAAQRTIDTVMETAQVQPEVLKASMMKEIEYRKTETVFTATPRKDMEQHWPEIEGNSVKFIASLDAALSSATVVEDE